MTLAPYSDVLIEAPSGLAGNLLITCLVRAGVPRSLIESLPAQLELPGFSVLWDGHDVCDGQGGRFDSDSRHLIEHVVARITTPGIAVLVEHALGLVLEPGRARDHIACDTAFDVTAFFTGLAALGWPKLKVVGPLPSTASDHPNSRMLLADWAWTPVPVDLELVTPTAAGVPRTYECGQMERLPATAQWVGDVAGRFARHAHLDPVRVWVDA